MDEASPKSNPSLAEGALLSWKRLAEYLVAGVVACSAIGVGTYLGLSTAVRTATGQQLVQSLNRSYLDVGDQIPDYELWDIDSPQKYSARQLLAGKPALLLFVSKSCGACTIMSDYWEQKVVPHIRKDIVLIAIYDDGDWYGDSTRSENQRPFPMVTAFTTDRESQKDHDGIVTTPTLIALSADGHIRLIASGFSRPVNSDFLNNLL